MKDSRADVLRFWFEETAPVQWFQINPAFDTAVCAHFSDIYRMACDGFYDGWAHDADGVLALILLFDQFPRNMFRGTTKAYATNPRACSLAEQALDTGFDKIHPPQRRRFFYQPFMRSEELIHLHLALRLFASIVDDDPMSIEYTKRRIAIIERFGRYPSRNAILGRKNTPDEEKYLTDGLINS